MTTCVLVGALSMVALAGSASAAQTKSKPVHRGADRHILCAWNNAYGVYAYAPFKVGSTVYDQGQIIQSPDYNCGSDSSTVYADSKVCGAFGCSWEDRGHTTAQVQTTDWIVQPSQPCRSGTNRYRTHTKFNFQYFDPGPPPQLNPGSVHAYSSSEPEFTC